VIEVLWPERVAAQEVCMHARNRWLFVPALLAAAAVAYGLSKPSASDGPIKLLGCIVTPGGVLEALVDSQTDDIMSCDIRCSYELGDRMFQQRFNVSIPGRYQGRVGQVDAVGAKPGNYQGEISNCRKITR
jgi:hypothetical protein